jgi:glycine betaine/choline ABC-type transport system substrate-binding protein
MRRSILIASVVTLCVTGCSRGPKLWVGSKTFTEQVILGEILAQHLEQRLGQPVGRRLNLGGTLLAHQGLVSGSIDLYPEYTGTALVAILKLPSTSESAAALARVREEYRRRWQVEWVAPLGFSNTYTLVVRGEEARARKFQTISDAVRRDSPWTLGAQYEFALREDGLPGLMKAYGLPVKGPPVTMHYGLLYRALDQRSVDMIATNSTDGLLSSMDVKPLIDDKKYFPPYDAAIAVRSQTLQSYPGLLTALEALRGKITNEMMQRLNYEVDGKHRMPAEVASEFLRNAQKDQ